MFRQALGKCLGSGPQSPGCSNYRGALSCCGTDSIDPRAVMPNPMNEPTCRLDGTDVKKGACEKKCSLVNDGDCLSSCMSEYPVKEVSFQWFLDRACIYAYNADCFGSPMGIDLAMRDVRSNLTSLQKNVVVPLEAMFGDMRQPKQPLQ